MASTRCTVEQRSAVLLVVLSRQPRWLLALVVLGVFVGALVLPAVPAAACLVLLLAFIAWLSYLSWPGLDRGARALRVLSWVGLAVLGVSALG